MEKIGNLMEGVLPVHRSPLGNESVFLDYDALKFYIDTLNDVYNKFIVTSKYKNDIYLYIGVFVVLEMALGDHLSDAIKQPLIKTGMSKTACYFTAFLKNGVQSEVVDALNAFYGDDAKCEIEIYQENVIKIKINL